MRGADTKKRVVAARADKLIATAREVLQEPIDIKRRIGISRAGRVDAVGDAIVAILTPPVE